MKGKTKGLIKALLLSRLVYLALAMYHKKIVANFRAAYCNFAVHRKMLALESNQLHKFADCFAWYRIRSKVYVQYMCKGEESMP